MAVDFKNQKLSKTVARGVKLFKRIMTSFLSTGPPIKDICYVPQAFLPLTSGEKWLEASDSQGPTFHSKAYGMHDSAPMEIPQTSQKLSRSAFQ